MISADVVLLTGPISDAIGVEATLILAVVSAVVSQALFFGRKARQRERKPSERQATL